jgi:hypothetical protein
MSTNEQNPAGSMPDVSMLTRLANEFFRGQPEFATSVVPDKPEPREVTPQFTTRLPEVGMPMQSIPMPPSAGALPMAPGVTETSPFLMTPAAVMTSPFSMPVPEIGSLISDPRALATGPSASPFSLPMPEFGMPFPSFESAVPVLPALPPLRNDQEAKVLYDQPSSFYFLEPPSAP